jgi:MFS family permease
LNAIPPSTARGLAAPSRPLSLGTIFLTLYIDLVGFSIIFPLFPAMLKHYLAREGHAGLLGVVLQGLDQVSAWAGGGDRYTPVLFGGFLGSLYSFLQFGCAPVWGGLSDKHGRRPILLLTCAGTVLSYLLWVFSGSFWMLVMARLFGGAMSGNLSVATAAVADVTTREHRAKGMGMVGAAFGLGFVTGPAIGGISAHWNLLEAHPGLAAWGINPFSVPALAALVLAAINLVQIAARFRESLPPTARAKDHPVLARDPLRMLRTRLEGPVRRTVFAYFIFIFAFSGMEFSLSFLAEDRFGFTTGQITMLMVFIGVVLIVTQGGIVRRVVPRFGERRVALAGLALVLAGFLNLSLATNVPWLYAGLACMALGSGCTTPSLTALVSLYTSNERQGQVLGSFRSYGALARAVGPIAAALMYWWWHSRIAYAFGGAVMVLAIAAALRLPTLPPHGAGDDQPPS